MQQFVVPQFIDVEDKIFGPITTRQFLIILVASFICFIAYKLADLALFAVILSLVGGGALVLAFVKINGQAFHFFLLNLAQTMRSPGQRIWYKSYPDDELNYLRKLGTEEAPEAEEAAHTAKRSHIRNLALQVNTGGYYQAEDEDF